MVVMMDYLMVESMVVSMAFHLVGKKEKRMVDLLGRQSVVSVMK